MSNREKVTQWKSYSNLSFTPHAWPLLLHRIRVMGQEATLAGTAEPRMGQLCPLADEEQVQKRTHTHRGPSNRG
jgi:hypothetical protein